MGTRYSFPSPSSPCDITPLRISQHMLVGRLPEPHSQRFRPPGLCNPSTSPSRRFTKRVTCHPILSPPPPRLARTQPSNPPALSPERERGALSPCIWRYAPLRGAAPHLPDPLALSARPGASPQPPGIHGVKTVNPSPLGLPQHAGSLPYCPNDTMCHPKEGLGVGGAAVTHGGPGDPSEAVPWGHVA